MLPDAVPGRVSPPAAICVDNVVVVVVVFSLGHCSPCFTHATSFVTPLTVPKHSMQYGSFPQSSLPHTQFFVYP
jgi:hypothetical protein